MPNKLSKENNYLKNIILGEKMQPIIEQVRVKEKSLIGLREDLFDILHLTINGKLKTELANTAINAAKQINMTYIVELKTRDLNRQIKNDEEKLSFFKNNKFLRS